MHIETTDALSNNLAGPINQAVSSANGAQFALMLSLASEAQIGRKVEWDETNFQIRESVVQLDQQVAPRLNGLLAAALQSGSGATFNLMNALYEERYIPVSTLTDQQTESPGNAARVDRRHSSDQTLGEIQASKKLADVLSSA